VAGHINLKPVVHLFSGASSQWLATFPTGVRSVGAMPDVNDDGLGEMAIAADPAEEVHLYHSLPRTTLQALGFRDKAFRCQIRGRSGETRELQASADFKTWEKVATVTNGSEPMEITDPAAVDQPQRFYRFIRAQ
jgi:hypothetical protein